MKSSAIVILLVFWTSSNLFCQIDSARIISIDRKVGVIESMAVIQTKATIDSSNNLSDPFQVQFYQNSQTAELSKVRKSIIKPDVQITYYFAGQFLIKVVVVDKSGKFGITADFYFHHNKLIHATRRNVDDDNTDRFLMREAKEYFDHYNRSVT